MLIYRILSVALYPFLELYLFWRVYKKKEDKYRLKERFGVATIKHPQKSIIWLHAVSVGESNSALVLVDGLLKEFPDSVILFTTTTLTSAQIIGKKITQYNGRVIHQFLPIDSYFCVKSFFDFWQISLAIFVESEIWPNLIDEAAQRQIPAFLINARLSLESLKKWKTAKFFGINIFDKFSTIFAQSVQDQQRIQNVVSSEVEYLGNLKSQASELEVNLAEVTKLKSQIGSRPLFVAVSTHQGEEEIILDAHKTLKKDFADLLTIIVPRHPNRAGEIITLFSNFNYAQRSKGQGVESSTEIYLADTIGELGIFYSLSNFAFIGGSLAKVGGHNPFEAIKLNCAVISGNQVFNFTQTYEDLLEDRGCIIVESKEQLTSAVSDMLQDEDMASTIAQAASASIKESQNTVSQVISRIAHFVE